MNDKGRAAFEICRVLSRAGHRALLAGGCVRDMVMGREPADYDIATSARPEKVAALFPTTIPVGAAFGVTIVVRPEGHFEVATFRHDGPYLDGRHPEHVDFVDEQGDAKRRDFTINAMFYDPEAESILDYVGGREDLCAGIIRTVGEPRERLQEDHLRMLRGVRFAARFAFEIESDTARAIRELASLVTRTSNERIRDELLKILTEGAARRGFEMMDRLGLLREVLPEVAAMKDVEQPPPFHPEGDVFQHTLLMLEHMATPSPTLALGVLLHDVGKPPTQSFADRIRFNNHARVGADMAQAICQRLRMSRRDTERVVWLVDQHMRVASAPKMRASKLKRLVREEGFDELLELCRLDCVASHNDTTTVEWLREYTQQLGPEIAHPKPLLCGNDLIEMGYRPGPLFGEILRTIEDAQLEDLISTPDEARCFVRDNWPLQQYSDTP